MGPRRRKAEMEKIAKMFDEAKSNSDVKVKLAIDTYELVDKHINKLDTDLAKFETEMREAGGRLSQTESEDEEILRQKKEKKKKKKALMREEEGRKKVEPVTPVTPCAEVPIVDMPVDPNEPTYCLCQQVSYGEMIGIARLNGSTSAAWVSSPSPREDGIAQNARLCSRSRSERAPFRWIASLCKKKLYKFALKLLFYFQLLNFRERLISATILM